MDLLEEAFEAVPPIQRTLYGCDAETTRVDLEFQVSLTAIALILMINLGNFADLLIIESSRNKAASGNTVRAHTPDSDPILLNCYRPQVGFSP